MTRPMVDPKARSFSIVVRDDDYRLHRHKNMDEAIREAERLARSVPGHAFYVLSAHKIAGPIDDPAKARDLVDVSVEVELPF